MSNDVIQAKYDQLDAVARKFKQQAQATTALHARIARSAHALQQGGWQGRGAAAFFAEMNGVVYPTMQRLSQALDEAHTVTLQISAIMQQAEQEAAARFRSGADAGSGAADSTGGDDGGGFLGGVGDFFTGMWKEGKESVVGLYNMVRHPVETAQGIVHAIKNPGEFWEAFKQPYVEAWENGRPWEAIGRGTMFLGTALVGTKGADKLSKASKVNQATRVTAEAADVARVFQPVNAADELSRVAAGSTREAGIGRYIAQQSTHQVKDADRVVLGGYPHYINEAKTNGGIYYSTTPDVWNVMKAVEDGGNGRGWAANREFLQAQMERGAERFELKGETIDEVLSDAQRAQSGTGDEIRFLRQYGYQYGYKEIDNAWVKVGDWRASHMERIGGGSVGPILGRIEDAQSLDQYDDTEGVRR